MKDLDEWGAQVFGVDESEHMVDMARGRLPHRSGHIVQRDIRDLSCYPDKTFDIVLSDYVLHYLEDPQRALEEFGRVLKPGGILMVFVHHPASQREFLFPDERETEGVKLLWAKLPSGISVRQVFHEATDYLSPDFLKQFRPLRIMEGRGADPLHPGKGLKEYYGVIAQKNHEE